VSLNNRLAQMSRTAESRSVWISFDLPLIPY